LSPVVIVYPKSKKTRKRKRENTQVTQQELPAATWDVTAIEIDDDNDNE